MAINERVVVITGATGGLGRVVARQFAERGARLVLVGRDGNKLQALGQELGLPQERWLAFTADLTDPEEAPKLLDASLDKFGRADILLNLVGGWTGGKTVADSSAEEVSWMIRQHLWTTFFLAQAIIPPMVLNGWGRLIVVSSPNAGTPPAKGAPYSIGKAAQEALVATIAEEVRGSGVTANVIRVKTIDIEHERENQSSSKTSGWTTPEEIAAAILLLCSEEANRMNGARLPLYGSS